MKTAMTELFGIEHPIMQGGMHWVGFAENGGGGVQRRRAGDHHRLDATHAGRICRARSRGVAK